MPRKNDVPTLSNEAIAELERMERDSLLESVEGELLTAELGQVPSVVTPVEKPEVGSW